MTDQQAETMYTCEGTNEHRETYIHHVYAVIECTFKLWQGSASKGSYQSAAPVCFEHMSRDQAYTNLVYGLNTGDQRMNPFRLRYSDLRTRGIDQAERDLATQE